MSSPDKVYSVDGHEIHCTHLDRLIFPDDRITKGDVIEYYARIAEFMIPHIKDYPISMQRFPEGIGEAGFYQKEAAEYFPEFIIRVRVPLREQDIIKEQVCINNSATLLYLANQGVITSHLWLSKRTRLEYPDRMIFDLDPESETDFPHVMSMAKALRKLCEKKGLTVWPLITGSKGMHLVIPLIPEATFDEVKPIAHAIAMDLVNTHPDIVTLEVHKDKRKGRIFIDTLRNAYGQTAVAPYSLRPRARAPIATPITWEEVTSTLHPRKYTLKNIFRRLGQKEDPWKEMEKSAVSLKRI